MATQSLFSLPGPHAWTHASAEGSWAKRKPKKTTQKKNPLAMSYKHNFVLWYKKLKNSERKFPHLKIPSVSSAKTKTASRLFMISPAHTVNSESAWVWARFTYTRLHLFQQVCYQNHHPRQADPWASFWEAKYFICISIINSVYITQSTNTADNLLIKYMVKHWQDVTQFEIIF